jgi:hypothetical protein
LAILAKAIKSVKETRKLVGSRTATKMYSKVGSGQRAYISSSRSLQRFDSKGRAST